MPHRSFAPLFTGGWPHTIAAAYWPYEVEPPTDTHILCLPDGDAMLLWENRPKPWHSGDRVVVMVHGLCGDATSNYMTRIATKLVSRHCLVIRVNLRSAGPGAGLARGIYHSGRSEDVREVLHWVSATFIDSPVTVMGFSLGGNLALLLGGQDGSSPTGGLDSVIAVCPPVDLVSSAKLIRRPSRRPVSHFFGYLLINAMREHHARFPDLEPFPSLPRFPTLLQFDAAYTAPRNGFRDAQHYYESCSSLGIIPNISVPTLILSAEDDPVVDGRAVSRLKRTPNVDVVLTRTGGHVGFIARQRAVPPARRWMDDLVLDWMTRKSLL